MSYKSNKKNRNNKKKNMNTALKTYMHKQENKYIKQCLKVIAKERREVTNIYDHFMRQQLPGINLNKKSSNVSPETRRKFEEHIYKNSSFDRYSGKMLDIKPYGYANMCYQNAFYYCKMMNKKANKNKYGIVGGWNLINRKWDVTWSAELHCVVYDYELEKYYDVTEDYDGMKTKLFIMDPGFTMFINVKADTIHKFM